MIEAEKANIESTMTVTRMCALLGVDRRRYYEWRARQGAGPSARQQRAAELTERIRGFHAASDGTYGAPRIHADLQDAGVAVSRKTVAKLMQADGITGISPRTWHLATTVHGEDPFPVPDLIERQFDQGERDVAWFSDITYLHTGEGWAYLCVVRDGNSRRVLGRTVGDSLHTDLVEDALRQAVALRGHLPRQVIFHADRGTQGEFNRSSQHLDREVKRWEQPHGRSGSVRIEDRSRHRDGPRSRGGRTESRSGRLSLAA